MEARIATLEHAVADTRDRLTRVEAKLDHVAHDVGQFKWWAAGSAVAIILTMIGTVIGTGFGIQQMTVSTFQAAGQQTAPQPPVIIHVPAPAPAPAPARTK